MGKGFRSVGLGCGGWLAWVRRVAAMKWWLWSLVVGLVGLRFHGLCWVVVRVLDVVMVVVVV